MEKFSDLRADTVIIMFGGRCGAAGNAETKRSEEGRDRVGNIFLGGEGGGGEREFGIYLRIERIIKILL